MKDPTRLSAIKALKPTPGPWFIHSRDGDNTFEVPSAYADVFDDDKAVPVLEYGLLGDTEIHTNYDFVLAAANPEYGLQALAAEVERLQEREKPVKMDASRTWPRGTGDGTLRECDCGNITGWHPYCPHCGRKLEWK